MLMTLLKALYLVPVLGRMIREALEGPDEALLAFLANIVMVVILLVTIFGFAGLITIALSGAVVMFVVIFDITRGKVE